MAQYICGLSTPQTGPPGTATELTRRTQTQHKQKSASLDALLAGVPGFEPGNAGTKTRCLTAWLYPNIIGMIARESVFVNTLSQLFARHFKNAGTDTSLPASVQAVGPTETDTRPLSLLSKRESNSRLAASQVRTWVSFDLEETRFSTKLSDRRFHSQIVLSSLQPR